MTREAEGPLPPGSVVGILGGGQLGRMLALAAARLGLCCHVFSPDPDSPAFAVAEAATVASYDDLEALSAFAGAVDVVTYEFENVPAVAADHLQSRVPVRPGARALAVSQDRLAEKAFLADLGIAVAPHAAVADGPSLQAAISAIGLPAILKTRRFGYDGKGQALLRRAADIEPGLQAMRGAPAILEGLIPFTREISVIAVRGTGGETAAYSPAENVHRDGILHTSTVPAQITEATAAEAARIARRVLEALDYVGVLGVELFVASDGSGERLLVNEIAPRVHNSGHWTEDACAVSQFENHIRAVAGWPLGTTQRHSDTVMTNLIGAEVDAWPALAADWEARLHLYGKRETRPGRKMGHVNRLSRGAKAPASRPVESSAASISGLEHVQLAMPRDEEATARAFYGGVLGLAEVAKPPNLARRGGCWFQSGNLRLHLGVEEPFQPARKAHPAFLTGDLRALAERLRRHGHEPRTEEPLEGYSRLYVDDPFGNRLELMQLEEGLA